MGIFSHKKDGGVTAIFDIGSGSVGAALVESKNSEKPRILSSSREFLSLQQSFTFERFLSSMGGAFLKSAGHIKERDEHVDSVMCTLSAPWYISQTRSIIHEEKKPFTLTQKKIDQFVAEEVERVREEFANQYEDMVKGDVEVIEMTTTHIKLNGYETNTPLGKQVNKFECSLYISITSAKVLNVLRNNVRAVFGATPVSFNTFSLVSFSALRDIHTNLSNFMFIDISGEATDVTVVRNNTLVETLSSPFGKHFILRSIASGLDTTLEEALSSLALFQDKKMINDAGMKMQKILSGCRKEWEKAFVEQLSSLSAHTVLPQHIFLVTDEPFTLWFEHVVKRGTYGNIPIIGGEFSVEALKTEVLAKFGSFDLDVPRDVFIILEALFVHKTSK